MNKQYNNHTADKEIAYKGFYNGDRYYAVSYDNTYIKECIFEIDAAISRNTVDMCYCSHILIDAIERTRKYTRNVTIKLLEE